MKHEGEQAMLPHVRRRIRVGAQVPHGAASLNLRGVARLQLRLVALFGLRLAMFER